MSIYTKRADMLPICMCNRTIGRYDGKSFVYKRRCYLFDNYYKSYYVGAKLKLAGFKTCSI